MDQDRDEFQEIREFWAVFCSIHSTKGLDLPLLVHRWIETTRESLSKRAAEISFDELCAAGCSPVSLTIALSAIRISERAAEKWRDTIGSTRQRDKIIRTLKKSADVLEAVNERFIDVLLRDARLALGEDLRESLSADSIQSPLQTNVEWPAYAPAPDPAIVVRALRLSARVLGMFEAIAEKTQAHSRERARVVSFRNLRGLRLTRQYGTLATGFRTTPGFLSIRVRRGRTAIT